MCGLALSLYLFSELAPPMVYVDSLRGMPIVAPIPPPAVFFPPPDPQLHAKIVNQIDYYFRYLFAFCLIGNVISFFFFVCSCLVIITIISLFKYVGLLIAIVLHFLLLQ